MTFLLCDSVEKGAADRHSCSRDSHWWVPVEQRGKTLLLAGGGATSSSLHQTRAPNAAKAAAKRVNWKLLAVTLNSSPPPCFGTVGVYGWCVLKYTQTVFKFTFSSGLRISAPCPCTVDRAHTKRNWTLASSVLRASWCESPLIRTFLQTQRWLILSDVQVLLGQRWTVFCGGVSLYCARKGAKISTSTQVL